MNTTIQFWILLFVINSYYFIPRYLLEIFHSQFFPVHDLTKGPVGERLRAILIRKNYDILRVSVDIIVLVLLYPLLLKDSVPVLHYSIFLCLYFWLSLLYQVYYHSFHRIYHLDPMFFHDFLMLKTAVQIFKNEFGLKNVLIILTAAMIGISGAMILYYLVLISDHVVFGTWSYLCMGVLGAGALYSMLHYPYSKYPQLTFQSQIQSFIRNLILSYASKKSLAALTLKYMKQYNVDPEVQLTIRPNIYFIVIESYGRVVLQDPELRAQYLKYAPALEDALAGHGWHMTSGFTIAPVTGGASWISYTSMMYGLNVRNQGVYLTMLRNKYMAEYDSLFHWLKRQGYITFRISSLGGYERMEIPYDSYSRLYGIDHWIKYKDLKFNGEHYGFGPSPPDQYALWQGDWMSDHIAGLAPKAVFFITQNSHTPYDSPMTIAEDWKSLNNGVTAIRKPSAFWSRPKFEKYGGAIRYQLEFLTDFIVKKGAEGDIFILVGDHQPPSLSVAMDNFETPIHIIARNPDFTGYWRSCGFVEGLNPEPGVSIRQEAVHWLMLRGLIGSYARTGAKLPEYLAQGIPY